MPRVTFRDCGLATICTERESLLDCALTSGVEISHVCGGEGSCGTCRVEVIDGWDRLTPQTQDETSRDMNAPYRLACQASPRDDVIVRVAAID